MGHRFLYFLVSICSAKQQALHLFSNLKGDQGIFFNHRNTFLESTVLNSSALGAWDLEERAWELDTELSYCRRVAVVLEGGCEG